jgi:hypothetical protein
MNMEGCRSSEQAKGGYHADEAKAMVAMKMGDKHVAELAETGPATTQLHLRAFAAVNHHQLAANLDQLRGGIVAQSGQRTTATQDMYTKQFHKKRMTGVTS